MLTSQIKDKWWVILLGIASPLWLYAGFIQLLKQSLVNAVCLLALGALAVATAIHSFTSNNQNVKNWLLSAWASISALFTVLRAIQEGQKDYSGRWILLGTLSLILLIGIVHLIRQYFLKFKARVGIED